MPITAHCPKCKRLAYLSGGVCEFCGYELPPEVVGHVVGREIVQETRLRARDIRHPEPETSKTRELLSDSLFTRLDTAQSTLMDIHRFLAQRARYQREAAQLAVIAEDLVSFTKQLARGE